jgi:DNA repair exonuclease SbcCD ATPase subunit
MTDADDAVTIERLDVVRAPGFERDGFLLDDFCEGINLVHGPNAAGKTTTADCIEALLWPDVADGERVTGQLSMNGDQWQVELDHGSVDYRQNGRENGAPTLPTADQRDRYRLSLHDLLQQETTDENFAEIITRESAGGFDLQAAHSELEYADSPITRRNGVYREAAEAIEEWREQDSEGATLEEERPRLERLRERLEGARAAQERCEVLDRAVAYHEKQRACRREREQLDEFSDVLDRVNGDEYETVEELDEEISELERDRREARERIDDARETLEDLDLPEDGVEKGFISGLKKHRDQLENAEERREDILADLEGARERRATARQTLQLDVTDDDLADLDPGTWEELSEFARLADDLRQTQQMQEAIRRWGEDSDIQETDLSDLERASRALEQWLSTPAEPDVDTSGADAAVRIGAAAGVVVSLAGLALGALVHPGLFGVVLIGIGLAVYGYQQREPEPTGSSDRETHQSSYQSAGLEPPASWTPEDVQSRLVDLYEKIAAHKIDEERRHERDSRLQDLDVEEKRARLEAQREQLLEGLGAAPDTDNIELAVLSRRVHDWQEHHDEVLGLEERLETTEKQIDDRLDELRSALDDYGVGAIENAADATEAIRELDERREKHDRATTQLDRAEDDLETFEAKIDDRTTERAQVFERLDLATGEVDELQRLCEQVDEYESQQREYNEASAVAREKREALEAHPEFDESLLDRELDDLREEQSKVEDRADEREELQKQVTEIETKINQAKKERVAEEARKERERALDALGEQLEEDYSAMVGDALVEYVEDRAVRASRPAVFDRANDLLATITHGQYELELEESDQTFRAYDTTRERYFDLDELSSGTRVQLLLAVRLAFVDQQEQGDQLPVLFDETLANTDDHRARVLIDAMVELAREGRQVFYFTAQGDELAKWMAALDDEPDVEWTTVDLTEARDLDDSIEVPDYTTDDLSPDLPDPDEHDHDAYGSALGVDRFQPRRGAGTAHLWYVVDDVRVLHELLEVRVERWGQLRTLLERDAASLLPDDDDAVERARQNGLAIEQFVEAWQIGRGEPVTRDVLDNADGVTDTYLDRVTELARDLDGDGQALVEALYDGQVDRFRRNKAEELEEYLVEHGHIVARDQLKKEDIRLRMIETLVDEDVPTETAADRATELLTRLTAENSE